MGIQKELIDCNNWILEQDDDFVSGYGQGNYALGLARLAWQAAQAKANKQFENFIDQAIEDSACADERRSLQDLLDEFQEQAND